jgi:autotransporter-associated beta strand protein
MIRQRLLFRLAPVLAAILSNHAAAATCWWDGGSADIAGNGNGVSAGGVGTWNTTIKNWDPGSGQPMAAWNNASNDTAVFAGTAGTVTMGTAITAGSLTLGSAHILANGGNNLTLTGTGISGSAAATLSGIGNLIVNSSQTWSNTSGTMTIASPVSTGAHLLTLNTGNNHLDVTGKISGNGGLTVNSTATTPTSPDNSGNPTLSNTNDYFGTTTVSGFIWLNSGGLAALGADTSPIQLNAGGFRLTGTGTIARGLNLTGTCGISKTDGTTTVNGVISGAGNFQVSANSGSGATVVLANANTFTGNCLSMTDGTVRLAHANALAAANLRFGDSNGRSTFDLATHNLAYNIGGLGNPALSNSNNPLNLGTGLGAGGDGLVSFGANNQSNTYVGILSGGAGFKKVGTGVQTLIGANTYTGNTVVATGTLKLGKISGQTGVSCTTGTTGTNVKRVTALASVTNLYIGQAVSGALIPQGARITNINTASQITLDLGPTTPATATTVDFSDMVGSIAASPIIDVQAGAVLDVSAITGGLSLGATQTLQGSGNITGSVTSDGRVAPGSNGTGTLTLSQNYTQNAGGTLRFAPQSATATAALVVNGTANLNGTLEVTLANGYVPLANDTLAVLRADTALNGSFATTQLPGLPGGLEWEVITTANSISLKVVAVASALSVTPSSNDFGGVLTGATAQKTFVLTNTGATPLTGTAAVTGAPFAVVSGGSYSLNPGATANVVVEFAPTTVGTFTDELVLAGAGINATYQLSGTGIIPGVLGVSPASRDLGGVLHGTTAQTTFVVTNTGGLPLTGTASVGGPFVVVSGASYSVNPGGSANVVVQFNAPAAAGACSEAVLFTSNTGNVSRMIAATSLAGVPEVPADGTAAYSFNALPGMPAVSASGWKYLAPLATLKQTFIPRTDAFLTALGGQDGNGARPFALTSLSLKLNGYQNTDATFRVAVSRVEAGGARTLFFSQDFQQRVYGSTVRTWTFSEPVLLACDVTYELAITLVQGGLDSFGGGVTGTNLFVAASDYPDGTFSAPGDLWFGLAGTTVLPVFNSVALSGQPANVYYLDAGSNADSTNHDKLKGKLLGVNGHPEQLNFACPASWPPLTFAVANPATVTLQVQGSGGNHALTLNGAAEGETFLFAKAGGTVVAYLKLQCYPQRPVKMSYSYVQYPGESDHTLKHASAEIMAYISSVYAKANVAIQWTDNGIITYEWDHNGDGDSNTADDTELWSPLVTGWIPNRNSVFSNVFMLRNNKDDNYLGGTNGGGTSKGYGVATPPAVTAGYGAVVRCHLLRPASQFASTLAHEVGHNLGLFHTGIGAPTPLDNLMDVGRVGDSLWSWQWDTIHATLKTLPAALVNPDGNGNGIQDAWETTMFGGAAASANPPGGDPDGDGLDNLLEYALGTHPLQSNANPLAMTMPQVGASRYLRISVPKNPAATNLTFAAELSENAASWSGTGVVIEENTTDRFTARDSVPAGTAPRRFIRLKVTVNP